MNFPASRAQLRASLLRWSLVLVPLIMLLGFLSSAFGSANTPWFQSLVKPAIFPPPAAFAIVWAALFSIIGFALALVASAWGAHGRGLALGLFAVHFPITLAWTAVFFGMQSMAGGLIVLGVAVVTLIAVMAAFYRVRPLAAALLLPYFAWLCFASVLNYQFMLANPDGGNKDASGVVERFEL